MKYTGFYINLDRSPERRKAIEDELARNSLASYARFAASNGNEMKFPNPHLKDGEIGCFTSHHRLLKENAASAQPLHVIEDDIILSPQTGQVLNWAIESSQLAKFDILYTDVAIPLLNDACQEYKNYYDATVTRDASGKIEKVIFSAVDMQHLIFGSTCSYLVNPHSIGKLAALYEKELQTGATLPIDLFIRKLCQEGAIKVGCLFPFVTSIRPESCFATTMESRFDALPAMAANMLRHSFFVGCDWGQCLAAAQIFPQPAADDIHRQLMLRLLGYSLMPGYKKH
ncbi:MAG: glycosyltransferase family 25 protein [Alphaproteobacteria bacterium]|nr:glycosyltransferase family 25 protein [Alphaproteobacteria bacterium]